MTQHIHNTLILCTGNSARSILAEAILNRVGKGRFRAFSAGSHPKGAVHPMALELLRRKGYDTGVFRSKDWDEFTGPESPDLDFVFTVCDNAAGEVCPAWTGHPMKAHWGIPDPAAVDGDDAECMEAFRQAYAALEERIKRFVDLPMDGVDKSSLQSRLEEIGRG